MGKSDVAMEMEKVLRRVSMRIRREGRKVLRDFPITPAQFDVLQVIYFRGEKRMSDISKFLGITKSTTTGLVGRLIEAGFVEKRRSAYDKRSYIIKTSESGRTLIDNVISERISYLQNILSGFEGEDVEKLHFLLKQLLEEMDNSGKS